MAASRGAPTLYDPSFCDESFAATIWVHRDTLYEWVKVHPDFSDAKQIGKEQSRLWWEKKGQEGLFSQSEYDKESGTGSSKSMNAALWIFNMKNRFSEDWKDRHENHNTGEMALIWQEQKTYEPKPNNPTDNEDQ